MLLNFNKMYFILPIFKIEYYKTQYCLFSKIKILKNVLIFLKYHFKYYFKILTFIAAADLPNNINRFKIIYEFLTLKFNNRLRFKLINNELNSIFSIEKIFINAVWWEYEIWDMFGIIFLKQTNSIRLLTDYGFQGFPLRKDFPLSGYVDSKYNLIKNRISYENLELTQNYRIFNYNSPWNFDLVC